MISTGNQKTVVRKTAVRKLVPQEQQRFSLNYNNPHTQQHEGVCVSPGAEKLDQFTRDCIEWIVLEYQKTGSLKNEIGLRVHLVKSALAGSLSMDDYKAFLESKNRGRQAVNDVIGKVDEWAKECEGAPVTAEFLKSQRALHPGLFKSSGVGA